MLAKISVFKEKYLGFYSGFKMFLWVFKILYFVQRVQTVC